MKRKNFLSWGEAWSMLLCGQVIAACRVSRGGVSYLRRQACSIGRTLLSSGVGAYETLELS